MGAGKGGSHSHPHDHHDDDDYVEHGIDDGEAAFELTDIDSLTETGPGHGYVLAKTADPEIPIGLWEYHLNGEGEVCAAYFTSVPCCESGRCPHWTVIDQWQPLTTGSDLHCPTCGMAGRVNRGRWEDG